MSVDRGAARCTLASDENRHVPEVKRRPRGKGHTGDVRARGRVWSKMGDGTDRCQV